MITETVFVVHSQLKLILDTLHSSGELFSVILETISKQSNISENNIFDGYQAELKARVLPAPQLNSGEK